jgi:hypothetical protein
MDNLFNFISAHSDWILPFAPILLLCLYFAIESRWEAYTRKKNYEELKVLHELREKSIITQTEFDEKKAELLSV